MSNTINVKAPTQRTQFTAIRQILVDGGYDESLIEFIDGRIAQLDKKNAAPRKPTAQQIQNEAFRADILEWMEPNTVYSLADVHKGVPSIVASGISPSRVTACLTRLYNDGQLNRTEEKGKHYYSLA